MAAQYLAFLSLDMLGLGLTHIWAGETASSSREHQPGFVPREPVCSERKVPVISHSSPLVAEDRVEWFFYAPSPNRDQDAG